MTQPLSRLLRAGLLLGAVSLCFGTVASQAHPLLPSFSGYINCHL